VRIQAAIGEYTSLASTHGFYSPKEGPFGLEALLRRFSSAFALNMFDGLPVRDSLTVDEHEVGWYRMPLEYCGDFNIAASWEADQYACGPFALS
jgi:hypothetical protein